MKILLTGSNGFLGSFIKKNLKKNNMFIDFDLPKNNIMNFNKLNFLFKKKTRFNYSCGSRKRCSNK